MYVIIGFLGLVLSLQGIENSEIKIVGGNEAPDGAYPYQASVRFTEDHYCGGAIIDESHILTSARCIWGQHPRYMSVIVGTNNLNGTGGIKYSIQKLIPNSKFNYMLQQNDIGLIKVSDQFDFSSPTIAPISLPTTNVEDDVELILSGWGELKQAHKGEGQLADRLQEINLTSLNTTLCDFETAELFKYVSQKQICTAGNRGSGFCVGDQGGPLVDADKKVLEGIASWSIGCGKGHPDVYTRVFSYLDWIEKHRT